jgi:hypothetical protein
LTTISGETDKKEKAIEMVKQTITVFSEAKLNMRSFAKNNQTLLHHLSEKGLKNEIIDILSPALDGQQNALGLRWDNKSDKFKFDPSSIVQAAEEIGKDVTKTKILSISARVFDQIGFLAHTTLLLKIIYQKLWEKGTGWDEEATPEVKDTWKVIMSGLTDFSRLEIPRWIGYTANSIISAEIHVFGDASESAYGAVVYIRLQRKNENPNITLLASKTRVAPLPKKKVTLPSRF